MNAASKPTMVVTFGRPFLSAKVLPHCNECEGGFLIAGPDSATARPCEACRAPVEAASAVRAARIPAVSFVAAGPILGAPKVKAAEAREWTKARDHLLRCVNTAMVLERNEELTEVPVTLAGVAGAAGSGKTWLLVHALVCGLRMGLQGLYVAAGDPFSAMAALGGGDIGIGVRSAQRVPLLALDDIGGHRNEKASAIVRDILGVRADRLMPTLFTTPRARVDLQTEMGESIADQVQSACVSLVHGSLRGST